jgi:glycosyltransferase involved in cell wall biosynthesis
MRLDDTTTDSDRTSGSPGCKVSIVINNYNYEHFLGRAIESALDQSYDPVEVVVVDDGSTDGSRGVMRRYSDRVVIVEQANGGQAAAINAGFVACRGDLVIFLDADDALYPTAAECIVQRFHPGVAKLQFRLDAVDENGAALGFTNPPDSQPLGDGRVVETLVRSGRYVVPVMSGNAYPRQVLERILPMPADEWRIAADGYLVTAAPFFGTVAAIEECLGAYRIHGSNAWAPGTADAINLPRRILHDLAKYELIRSLAAASGLPVKHLDRTDHVHLRHRLASLRLSARAHPLKSDRRLTLALRGIFQTLFNSGLDPRRRLIFASWFAIVAFGPRPIAYKAILLLYLPQERRTARRKG